MKIRVLLAKQGLIDALVLLYINSYFSTVSTNECQLCNFDDETISVCHEDRQRFVFVYDVIDYIYLYRCIYIL